jgi:threonyl-tRNA synthetase
MRTEGFRVDTSEADEQLGKRIRSAKLERIPFVLVVGDDDVKNSTVGVNPRGGDVIRDVKVDAFIAQLHEETRTEAAVGTL